MNRIMILLVVMLFSCNSIKTQKLNKAQIVYLEKLNFIGLYNEGKIEPSSKDLKEVALFFEEITNIKANIFESFDPFIDPSEQNLLDWKEWYKNNKERLYWDEVGKKVKLKE